MSFKDKQVLIVEDNTKSMELIEKCLCDFEELILFKAENSEKAYKYAMENNIELFIVDLILDTEKPGDVSGIKFVEKIRTVERYKFAPIIVTTSLEDPKMHIYAQLHCYRYFEKPYDMKEFKHSVKEALKYNIAKEQRQFFYYKNDGVIYSIKIKEIVYIKNSGVKTCIYQVGNRKISIPYRSCKNILLELSSDKFLKCNKNTIINIEYVHNVDAVNRYITLINGYGVIDIGARMKKRFLDEFLEK